MKRELAMVEAMERALQAELEPQTLDDVTDLENRLKAGLEELAQRRQQLEKRSSDDEEN